MGLLDDAIREHLELKRRHGADPVKLRARSERRSPRKPQPSGEEHEDADASGRRSTSKLPRT